MKKRLITATSIVLMTAFLVLLCMKRWNAWFGNPTEPPYSSLSAPGRIQLTFGSEGAYSRNVSWQCGDSLADSRLALTREHSADTVFLPAQGKVFRTTGGTTVSYHTEIRGLSAGIYHYNVRTAGQQSDWYRFRVNRPDDDCSFIYLGDIQDTINGVTKDFVRQIRKHVPQADFWVLGGDVIERPHDRYWAEYFHSMDSLAQTLPIIAVPGNHEYLKGLTRRLEERFVYTFSYFTESRYKGHAVSRTDYGNMTILTLDSNRDFWTLLSQRRWLKRALRESVHAQWKVVVLHHPVYSIKGKMNNLMVRWAFNPLFKKYEVDLVLQGHEHGYARMISKGRHHRLTTPVYLVGQSSPKDYRLYFNDRYDRFGTGKRFYQTVTARGDSLFVQSYTDTDDLYDDVCIVKDGQSRQVSDRAVDIPQELEFNPQRRHMSDKKRREYEEDMRKWLKKMSMVGSLQSTDN